MRRYVSPARASKFAANLGHSEDHVLYFRNTCESFLDATMPARRLGKRAYENVSDYS